MFPARMESSLLRLLGQHSTNRPPKQGCHDFFYKYLNLLFSFDNGARESGPNAAKYNFLEPIGQTIGRVPRQRGLPSLSVLWWIHSQELVCLSFRFRKRIKPRPLTQKQHHLLKMKVFNFEPPHQREFNIKKTNHLLSSSKMLTSR